MNYGKICNKICNKNLQRENNAIRTEHTMQLLPTCHTNKFKLK